jgi:SNF2 family DNA or RNA helicase
MDYKSFLNKKSQMNYYDGFEPIFMPDFLFDFQKSLVEWSVKKGRCAIFADCGLGKTPIQLVWAENILRKTNGKVLILTPLSVSHQTVKEAEKFGIDAVRSINGRPYNGITVTNYEKLHLFDHTDFEAVVCDESSILKNFNGTRRNEITQFMKKKKYRLLCTATAAPNDYIELGTSSEALGELGYMDMLGRFFKNNQSNCALKTKYRQAGDKMPQWSFKKHAINPFWKWVCSWARALRKPSDIGFDDDGFILPELVEMETVLKCSRPLPGKLFVEPALGLKEQREERKYTIKERCEAVFDKINGHSRSVIWCQLNNEGDLLEKMIPGAVQVKGGMSDDRKEDILWSFSNNDLKILITKPKIGAFGLNWQHCNHMTFFPTHSYEQYYQGVRRCWRFGQNEPVFVDVITTEGELSVLSNLKRKAKSADKMFDKLVRFMNKPEKIKIIGNYNKKERIPSWV